MCFFLLKVHSVTNSIKWFHRYNQTSKKLHFVVCYSKYKLQFTMLAGACTANCCSHHILTKTKEESYFNCSFWEISQVEMSWVRHRWLPQNNFFIPQQSSWVTSDQPSWVKMESESGVKASLLTADAIRGQTTNLKVQTDLMSCLGVTSSQELL